MSRLTRDGTAEPVSKNHILRREQGQGNIHFLCSANHEQGWIGNLTRLIITLAICDDHTYIHTHCTNSGCGEREAHQNGSMVIPEKAALVIRTTLRTTDPVPSLGRHLRNLTNSGLTRWHGLDGRRRGKREESRE